MYCRSWAKELNNMPINTANEVVRIFNDVIYKARIGQINQYSNVHTQASLPHFNQFSNASTPVASISPTDQSVIIQTPIASPNSDIVHCATLTPVSEPKGDQYSLADYFSKYKS